MITLPLRRLLDYRLACGSTVSFTAPVQLVTLLMYVLRGLVPLLACRDFVTRVRVFVPSCTLPHSFAHKVWMPYSTQACLLCLPGSSRPRTLGMLL